MIERVEDANVNRELALLLQNLMKKKAQENCDLTDKTSIQHEVEPTEKTDSGNSEPPENSMSSQSISSP